MIKDITLAQYLPGDSLVHRVDPRTKIVLTIAYITVVFFIASYRGFTICLVFIFTVIVCSGIPVKYALKGLKPVLVIIIFTSLINIFTVGGTPVLGYGPLSKITYEGLDLSVRMTLRLALLIIGVSVVTCTTTPISLTDGLEKLMKPLERIGVPVHEIAMMMAISLRFIPTIFEETEKIMKAQASRGADFDTGSLLQRAKSFVPVLVPLFISAFRRADELAAAMEARCYRGSRGRTRMKQLKFTRADAWAALVTALFTALLLFVEIV